MDNQPKTNEAFERFRDLAKKVVTTPKAVVDRREKEWKARQAAKAAPKKVDA